MFPFIIIYIIIGEYPQTSIRYQQLAKISCLVSVQEKTSRESRQAIFLGGGWKSISWNSLESNGQWLLGSSQAPHKNTFVLGVINQSCPNLFFEALKFYEVELLISGVFFLGEPMKSVILPFYKNHGTMAPSLKILETTKYCPLAVVFVDCHGIVGSAMCWKIKLYYTLAWAPAQNTGFHEDQERFWIEYIVPTMTTRVETQTPNQLYRL